MARKTQSDLIRWISAEKEKTADTERLEYLSEIETYVRTSSDRRDHLAWGPGDVVVHQRGSDETSKS